MSYNPNPMTRYISSQTFDPKPDEECETCGGSGSAMDMVCYGGMPHEIETDCPDCDGHGRYERNPCMEIELTRTYRRAKGIRKPVLTWSQTTSAPDTPEYIQFVWANSIRPHWIEHRNLSPEAEPWIRRCSQSTFASLSYKVGKDDGFDDGYLSIWSRTDLMNALIRCRQRDGESDHLYQYEVDHVRVEEIRGQKHIRWNG